MPEKKMVGLIIGGILIAVVAAYFIFKVLGLQPDMEFPKGKETLVRYYACSLAICTHGCDWLDQDGDGIGDRICLDNDTFTRECNLWCHDICKKFGNCGDTDDTTRCCGPEYNLSVSLIGEALFKCYVPQDCIPFVRCYVKHWSGSDLYNYEYYLHKYAEQPPYWYNVPKPYYDKIVDNEDAPVIIATKFWNGGETILDYNCLEDNVQGPVGPSDLDIFFPGQMRLEDEILGCTDYWGCGGKHIVGTAGIGQIILDESDAYEKYGCAGDCNVVDTPERYGFDQCQFQGEINIWSDWKNDHCADVFFNSTITTEGLGFDIECKKPECEDDPQYECCQKINLDDIKAGQTADYTIQITNNLRTGVKFRLNYGFSVENPDPPEAQPSCTFWDGNEQITDPIFVDDEEPKDFTMKCAPTGTGTYHIAVDATTGGRTESTGNIDLVVADYTWWVEPTEKTQNIDGAVRQTYKVHIKNYMGEITDFNIGVETKTISGGTLSCEFVANNNKDYTLTLNDNEHGEAHIICNKDKNTPTGEYQVTMTVDVDGMEQRSTTRTLNVKTCEGTIKLEFEPSKTVKSAKNLKINVSGLDGCGGRKVNISLEYLDFVVERCLPGEWDGKECIKDKVANSPGTYTFYASIDKNKDGVIDPDDGERASAQLKIYVDPPADIGLQSRDLSTDNFKWCHNDGDGDFTITCEMGNKENKVMIIDCPSDCRDLGIVPNDVCQMTYGGKWWATAVDCESIDDEELDSNEGNPWIKHDFDDPVTWCQNNGDSDMTITCTKTGNKPNLNIVVVDRGWDYADKTPDAICGSGWYATTVDCENVYTGKGDSDVPIDPYLNPVKQWCGDGGGEDLTVTCADKNSLNIIHVTQCANGDCSKFKLLGGKEGTPDELCEAIVSGLHATAVDCETIAYNKDEGMPSGDCTSHIDMCYHWVGDPWPPDFGYWDNCVNYCDPQSDRPNTPSSICCVSGKDYLSNGPDSTNAELSSPVPCLSPDNCTHTFVNCEDPCNFMDAYGIGRVMNARNVLVKDYQYAKLQGENGKCDSDDDCGKGWSCGILDDAYCDLSSNVCKLQIVNGNDEDYDSFLYIKISDTSRPVYGLRIDYKDCWNGPSLEVFIHTKNGWVYLNNHKLILGPDDKTAIITAKDYGLHAWEDADGILIAFSTGPYQAGYCDYIDYVGLLTSNYITPYCTDGTGDFNRIVDDGETCYWGLDCPTAGSGWNSKKSTGVGPFGECSCDPNYNSGAHCGKGYCYIEDKGFCYYNVQCTNGGWTNTGFDKCGSEQSCTADGCF